MRRSGELQQRGTHRARWRALSTVLALVAIIGYAIIAIPTGIVTVELSRAGSGRGADPRACFSCGRDGHDADASFCKRCGVLEKEGTERGPERGSTGAQGARSNRSRPRSAT